MIFVKKIKIQFSVTMIIFCVIITAVISCASLGTGLKSQIKSPEVYVIKAPVAGNYPQGLYKYPFKTGSPVTELFTQTIKWEPEVRKTFDTDTQYTATLILEPADRLRHTFKNVSLDDVKGLPTNGVDNITAENRGDNLVINIVFNRTARVNAASQLVFFDEFNGIALDTTKWDFCPEWDRQGRSSWRDDMVYVNGGTLHIKFRRDTELGAAKSKRKALADNWIRTGGIRTRTKNNRALFDNTYGYYEARLKIPQITGTWGGFWLMSPTQGILTDEGVIGTEIDIVETWGTPYNGALNWNGYAQRQKAVHSFSYDVPLPDINIFDGEFHTFALDWSPSEYIFYVDDIVFWRVDGGTQFKNSGINQNPNYIKLTMEGSEWKGELPPDFTEDEMLVDYVRVYNQPQIR